MSYPAAYRGAAARARAGSQKSSPASPPRPRPSGPANDNVGPRTPANRNVPRGRSPIPNSYTPTVGQAARAARFFAPKLLRLHPAARLALNLWDLYKWLYGDPMELLLPQTAGSKYAGLKVVHTCNTDDYNGSSDAGWGPYTARQPDWCLGLQAWGGQTFEEAVEALKSDVAQPWHNSLPWIADSLSKVVSTGERHHFLNSYRLSSDVYPFDPTTQPDPLPLRPGPPVWAEPQPVETPRSWPSVDPGALPINQPAPRPEPVPYRAVPHRRPDPWAVPGHRWTRGPARAPGTSPGPSLRPSQVPATRTTVEVRPDGSTRVKHEPEAAHTRRPPGRGEKEKKFRSRTAAAFANVARAIGGAGEVADLFEVAHDSLPAEFQADSDRIYDKAQHVFRHSDQIMWDEFWRNYAGNDLEDRAVGSVIGGPHGRKIGQAFHGL